MLVGKGCSNLGIVSVSWLGPVLRADFKCLREEVSERVSVAQHLKDIKDVVFSSIQAMLRDREALQNLMDKVRGSHNY